MEKKLKYKYQSDTTVRQSHNIYAPFENYHKYCNWIVVQAVELNNMVITLPPNIIADIWMHDVHFRQIFKRMTYMAHFVHYEKVVQRLLPWCNVDIVEYCTRFDNIEKEKLMNYFVK